MPKKQPNVIYMPKQNDLAGVDAFIEWYKSARPETVYLIKDEAHHAGVMEAVRVLCNTVMKSNPDTIIEVSPDPLIGTRILVEIITENFVWKDMMLHHEIFSQVDSYEVCARTDGKFMYGITFKNAYELAPPSTQKLTIITGKN